MNLNLKRLFARSMTGGLDLAERRSPPSPRSAKRQADVRHAGRNSRDRSARWPAGYYFAMRPVTLRIAVGPANSDDLKVVQALTQALRPDPQPYPAAADADRRRHRQRRRRWPRARPISPSSAAISTCRKTRRPWRRCARTSRCCGCRRPSRARARRPAPKITKIAQLAGRRIGVVGRTPANVNLLKVILQQYGVDPGQGRDRAVPGQRSRRRDPQPEGRCLSRRRPRQQQDHRGRDRGIDARRRHADLPRDRFGRGDRAEPPGLRGRRNSRRRLWRLARPARGRSQDHQLLAPHRRAQRICRNRPSPPSPGSCSRSGSSDGGIPAGREDRNPGYRQGRRDPGASRRRGLCRRRGKDLPRPLQRLHLVGPDGAVGDGLGRRMVRGLSEEGRAQQQHARCASGCWT